MIDRRSFMQSAAAAVAVAAVPVAALAGERRIESWWQSYRWEGIGGGRIRYWTEWRPVYDDGSVGPVERTEERTRSIHPVYYEGLGSNRT